MAEKSEKSPQDRGTTTISDTVVAKTAGIAAREVSGVHALGGAASQMIGAVRKRVGGGTDVTQGVSVEVGQTQAAVEMSIEVDYGEQIHKVAQHVRQRVVQRVETMTGLEVVEVDITVTDVYVEGEDSQQDQQNQQNQQRQQGQQSQEQGRSLR
ncbi:Asp23/Gls24 family envelope stress response protein [Streptomyces sulphureus]|uniref:Asp23/Gls24 family envelope stress response protein n=1 Tax=Streptomyces sulphureus TaxID=47758 RepID=UPI0003655E91|nr:Asp23/Gls24 family envelope stress response protein [Streptomyces sulphureus]